MNRCTSLQMLSTAQHDNPAGNGVAFTQYVSQAHVVRHVASGVAYAHMLTKPSVTACSSSDNAVQAGSVLAVMWH